jgi:hypothetical protein
MDVIAKSIKGFYRDRLMGPDNRLIYDSGWVSNVIVDDCRVLLARLIMNQVSGGIRYLAVGPGKEEWDDKDKGTPAPEDTTSDLVAPYYKIPVDSTKDTRLKLAYLDEEDEVVAEPPMPRLQITATLAPGFPPPPSETERTYPLREFGLFGGSPGPDRERYLINCVRHPVILKHETATLIRVIRLYF